eukprot:3296404-Pleurochrysis_carterae.AAC.2
MRLVAATELTMDKADSVAERKLMMQIAHARISVLDAERKIVIGAPRKKSLRVKYADACLTDARFRIESHIAGWQDRHSALRQRSFHKMVALAMTT